MTASEDDREFHTLPAKSSLQVLTDENGAGTVVLIGRADGRSVLMIFDRFTALKIADNIVDAANGLGEAFKVEK